MLKLRRSLTTTNTKYTGTGTWKKFGDSDPIKNDHSSLTKEIKDTIYLENVMISAITFDKRLLIHNIKFIDDKFKDSLLIKYKRMKAMRKSLLK